MALALGISLRPLKTIKTSVVILLSMLSASRPAIAQNFLWDYLKNYKLGVENSFTNDVATVFYDVDPGVYNDAKYCTQDNVHPNKSRCHYSIPADSQSGLGLFLQQAFRRKGLWHYEFDLSLSFRSMHEGMKHPEPKSPLQEVNFDLYGLFFKPHFTFGITPKSIFPDFLVSLGPSAQVYWGSTVINSTAHHTGARGVWRRSKVLSVLSYGELELVLWRFAREGALSLFTASERDTAQLYDGYVADVAVDHMTDIDVTFDRRSTGVKLLLSWP